MVAGKNGADDLSLWTNKFVTFPPSDEGALFAICSLVIDVNFGLVAIPCIVPALQALDVAFDADAIARRDEDRAKDFDRARNDGRRAEQTCRPQPELLRPAWPSNRRGMKESSSSGR